MTLHKLTGKQARYLRSLGHPIKPLVQIGRAGITETLVDQVQRALETHELIKVKLIKSAPLSAKEAGEELSQKASCHLAQCIGKTLLLYKPRKKEPTIQLPQPTKKGEV